MQLPAETQKAEILDWWEASHERICDALSERIPALYYRVDQEIEAMPLKDLLRKASFRSAKIEPLISEWRAKVYRELTHELDESMRSSLDLLNDGKSNDDLSYSEMAIAGAALAVTAAPVAGLPFFVGGLTTAGWLGISVLGGGLAVVPIAALAGSAFVLALGPSARAKAVAKLKSRLRENIHQAIETSVLGDPTQPATPSLKGVLLSELSSVTLKRLELVE